MARSVADTCGSDFTALFPDSIKEVEIIAVGGRRIIAPADQSWDDWFDAQGCSSDFMEQREQPEDQEREML
jgi:antitoxin VapB